MSDDIVTRLREAAQVDEYYAVTMHRPLIIAIADEIERLQSDLKIFRADWKAMIKQIEYLENENKRLKRSYLHG